MGTETAAVINAFEAPEADDDFIAGWEAAHKPLADEGAFASVLLHQALRPDAKFRFVSVAQLADPTHASGEMPFVAPPGLCKVVHEDGTPDGAQGVTLINPFEVPAQEDERFLAGWHHVRHILAGQRGYLGTRLHRSVTPTDLRFVNIARWSSPLMWFRATQQVEFQRAAAALPFASHPALYLVVAAPRRCDGGTTTFHRRAGTSAPRSGRLRDAL